ncbi:MAG TPA: hypothetical protein RMH99_15660 [Sandaracinaceae bacterium LLY-WYZ-13_1]|nr:hypothetical protein [Sandaracinaceae bacterium LLY-WYZ-13_1]
MLELEVAQGLAGALGEIGGALVGEQLRTGPLGAGAGDDVDDALGALGVVDEDGVEQVLIAATDVLHREELQRHAEGAQVGGVGGALGVGQHDVEVEAGSARRSRRPWLG